MWSLSARRAWIEIAPPGRVSGVCGSLSARRAWIEIGNVVVTAIPHVVALRKESVDRNLSLVLILSMSTSSLSARRAWIEMLVVWNHMLTVSESLSARRAWIEIVGFKNNRHKHSQSLSARRAWIEIILPRF